MYGEEVCGQQTGAAGVDSGAGTSDVGLAGDGTRYRALEIPIAITANSRQLVGRWWAVKRNISTQNKTKRAIPSEYGGKTTQGRPI